jgi:hypothetical protein
MGTTQDQPQYTIVQDFPDCASCTPVTPNSYEVQSCDTQAVKFISRSPFTLSPGNIVSLQSTPGCWEVVGDDTATPTDTATQLHKSCALCANQGGFVYYSFFCDGSTSPVYFTSTVQLTQGTIVKVLDGTHAGKCVSIISQNQSGFSQGNIDTSLAYDDCTSCQGLPQPQQCYEVVVSGSGAEITYVQNNQSYGPTSYLPGTYNICLSSYTLVSGTATFTSMGTLCISNFDCRPIRVRPSCHRLSGGSTGSQFEYMDSTGNFQNVFVNPNVIDFVCAGIGTVQRMSGNGSYQDLQSLCLQDDDCGIGIDFPIP